MLDEIRKLAGFKPNLAYLEVHLADHCNLNCKGCSHFSPIADPQFADLKTYARDLSQLQKLFTDIKKIVLLGGEPLLNPQIEEFLFITRQHFPRAKILIYTNGILLHKMPETFWNTCLKCRIDIDITIYPPLKLKEQSLAELVKEKGLKVYIHSVTNFQAFYNSKADTNPKTAFKRCRKRWYTPMIKDGNIYICPKPPTINAFNKRFGLKIPTDGFIDIHTKDLDGWTIKQKINEAATICRYCTLGWDEIPMFPWTRSRLILEDWDASVSKKTKK